MKYIFLLLTVSIQFVSISQNNLCVDIIKDISSLHNKYLLFRSDTLSINTGAIGVSISGSINRSETFHIEPFLQFSVMPDKSSMINLSGRKYLNDSGIITTSTESAYLDSYSYGKVDAESKSFSTGLNLYKRVSRYFGIGGGLHFTYIASEFTEYRANDIYYYSGGTYKFYTRIFEEVSHSKSKIVPSFPIVVRVYIPFENNLAIRFSLYGHIANQARLSCSIGFCF